MLVMYTYTWKMKKFFFILCVSSPISGLSSHFTHSYVRFFPYNRVTTTSLPFPYPRHTLLPIRNEISRNLLFVMMTLNVPSFFPLFSSFSLYFLEGILLYPPFFFAIAMNKMWIFYFFILFFILFFVRKRIFYETEQFFPFFRMLKCRKEKKN